MTIHKFFSFPTSRTVITVLLVILSMKSVAQKMIKQQKVTGVSLMVSYDFVQTDNRIFTMRDTFPIFYYGDYIAYRLPYFHSEERNDTVLSRSKEHNYFVFKKTDKIGMLFNTLNDDTAAKHFPADSFLSTMAFKDVQIPAEHNYDSLARKIISGDQLIEKYVILAAQRGNFIDTSYFYYAKNKRLLPYTLSPQLDSIKNSKLYKMRFIFAKGFSKRENRVLPKREFSYEIRDFVIRDEKELILFFEKYKSFNSPQ